jgi:hypothetical protein
MDPKVDENSNFWTNFPMCVYASLPPKIQAKLHYSFFLILTFCLFGYFVHLLFIITRIFGTTLIFQKVFVTTLALVQNQNKVLERCGRKMQPENHIHTSGNVGECEGMNPHTPK